MSAGIFQGVIIQMREAAPRALGAVDASGTVIASTDLSLMGQDLGLAVAPDAGDGVTCHDGRTFRTMPDADYAVFAEGEDELARTLCIMASVALAEAKAHYDENNDRATFIKSILSDHVLPGDINLRSKDLRFEEDVPRACLLVRQHIAADASVLTALREMFPNRQSDFVVTMNASDIVAVVEMNPKSGMGLQAVTAAVESKLSENEDLRFVIGVGAPAQSLRELADRYKECQVAIEIGKVFETERTVIYYENLGLGRLIYQLPTKLCEMFLSEVFKKNPIEALDQETLFTINRFFENNLNVSETSRRLFVHRNTLVYRLEKIKKLTGLDLREFDHAIVFKVALMVKKYLTSRESGYDL